MGQVRGTLVVDEGDDDVNDNEGPGTADTSRAVHNDGSTASLCTLHGGLLQADILGGGGGGAVAVITLWSVQPPLWARPLCIPAGSPGRPLAHVALRGPAMP